MKKIFSLLIGMVSLVAVAQTGEVHILSVNDMHAAIDKFPRFAAVADSLRALYPDLLVVSAGDNRTGNPINDRDPVSSRPMVELMNKTGFKYSAFGNHEFDGKIEGLRTVINNSYCTYLCANAYSPDSLRLHYSPFVIDKINGIKVGILGLIQTNDAGIPDCHPQHVGSMTFRPVKDVAMEYKWLRNECDVFILLTHNGYDDDLKLAYTMPEADMIIGGHSHTKLDPCVMENNVMITQTERWLKYATHTTISVTDGKVTDRKAELIDVANFGSVNKDVDAVVSNLINSSPLSEIIATAKSDFREKEELGCMMADALRAKTGADIAIQNNGGVRYDSKRAGGISVCDVYTLDPFGNEAMTFTLTGEELKEMLAAICRADDYGPCYVSGITYEIHLGKDNRDVKSVKIKGADGGKFDMKKSYKVAMNSYVASVSKYEKQDPGIALGKATNEMLEEYLREVKEVDYHGAKRVTVKQDQKYSR
ncbi:MAG: bifunctional metallophosphatase/5'-nucleotidase [Lepagella sp.]